MSCLFSSFFKKIASSDADKEKARPLQNGACSMWHLEWTRDTARLQAIRRELTLAGTWNFPLGTEKANEGHWVAHYTPRRDPYSEGSAVPAQEGAALRGAGTTG